MMSVKKLVVFVGVLCLSIKVEAYSLTSYSPNCLQSETHTADDMPTPNVDGILEYEHSVSEGAVAGNLMAAVPKNNPVKFIVVDAASGEALQSVVCVAKEYGVYSLTDASGEALLKNIPDGKCTVSLELLGYVNKKLDIVVDGSRLQTITVKMEEESLAIDDVVVVAERGSAGEATSSVIGRQALDHIQATSLKDIFQLLPGNVVTSNPSLTSAGVFRYPLLTHPISVCGLQYLTA